MKAVIKKISTVLIGRVLYEIFNYGFDYVVYPLVLLKFGFIHGLLILIAITAIINSAILIFYIRMNIDWLGYDYINIAKEWADNKSGILKFIGIVLRKSDILMFMFLSTFRDSFETTVYFKHSYNLSKAKTIAIFIASLLVGNLYWAFGVEVIINGWLRHIIHF